jgi:DNA-cytosine methyltransferase
MRWQKAGSRPLLLVDDDSATNRRRQIVGVADAASTKITVTLHELREFPKKLKWRRYIPYGLAQSGRARIVEKLVAPYLTPKTIVVAGTRFGENSLVRNALRDLGVAFILEITPAAYRTLARVKRHALLKRGVHWTQVSVIHPVTAKASLQRVAELNPIAIDGHEYRVVAFQFGRLTDTRRQIRIAVICGFGIARNDVARGLAWVRWIQSVRRRASRARWISATAAGTPPKVGTIVLQARSNIQLARQQDKNIFDMHERKRNFARRLTSGRKVLNTLELFAGAGGMGLGLLMSDHPFRLIASAEVHPIYTATLAYNYEWVASHERACADRVPEEIRPLDLRDGASLQTIASVGHAAGGVDIVIGGPPCQGFSNANRNSWSSRNPHNELVDVFFRYVRRLNPAVFVMENVQGILWTRTKRNEPSAIEQLARRATRDGYRLFPKLLDAVWYGVPQFRSRFFLVGIHRDLGYSNDDFGEWGPFPYPTHGPGTSAPYVTVRNAIRDLPKIVNGHNTTEMPYQPPQKTNPFLEQMRRWSRVDAVTDHVTSTHADYVIERYRRIPEGGNWADIRNTLTNYADVDRTHSNIYRRLAWNEPAVTIGHYRKSMLVHPSQHRGLSLREAARLQSFPDWFRFAGAESGPDGGSGLVHKQQQLANAVCPLVTKAIAEFLAEL